jgi:hypothetical protein
VEVHCAAAARIAVRAVDETGAPVEGQDLRLRRAPEGNAEPSDPGAALAEIDPLEQMFGGAVRQARTDGRGRATFEGVGAGRYAVVTDGPLVLLAPVLVEVSEAATPQDVEVRLTHGLAIRGVVRDAQGAPVAGVWVNAQSTGEQMDPFRGSAQTDARGEFVIQPLAAGSYQLNAWHQERGQALGVAARAGDQAVTVVLAPLPQVPAKDE